MWLIDFVRDQLRKIATPPSIPSNASELAEAERDIENGAALVESNVRAEWVRKARRFVGQGHYCLGAGGKDPKAQDPWSVCAKPETHTHEGLGRMFCDCSGFIDFCMGWSRNDPVYGWRYCDSIFADAKKQVRGDLGYEVPISEADIGDIVVYRSKDLDGDGDRDLIGHIGIVSWVPEKGRTWKTIKVIHCASRGPVAVRESDAMIWSKHGVVFRVRV